MERVRIPLQCAHLRGGVQGARGFRRIGSGELVDRPQKTMVCPTTDGWGDGGRDAGASGSALAVHSCVGQFSAMPDPPQSVTIRRVCTGKNGGLTFQYVHI